MPQRKRISLKAFLLPLSLLAMAAAIFRRKPDAWEYERIAEEVAVEPPAAAPPAARRRTTKRYALAAAFSMLFFAGAAFTAGAGDQMVRLMDEDAAALEGASSLTGSPDAGPRRTPRALPRGSSGCGSRRRRAGRGCPPRGCGARGRTRRGRRRQRRRRRRRTRCSRSPPAEVAPSTAAAQAAEPADEAAAARRHPLRALHPGRTGRKPPRRQAVGVQARAGGEGEPGEEVGRQARGRTARQGTRGRGRARR